MRIMVTGAEGKLGREMVARLARDHDVVGVDIGDFPITDFAATEAAITAAAPDLVCHCAAYTDVDNCEREPLRAFRVNAVGAWNVAAACRAAEATMIYVSSDYVFDGEKSEPYTEYDTPRPLSVYGASKLAGERHVRELAPRHFIVRTA